MTVTRELLKRSIRETTVAEVNSALEARLIEHAVNVKDEDLTEIAFMIQKPDEGQTKEVVMFMKLMNDNRIQTFYSTNDCPFPPDGKVQVIHVDDTFVCKEI